MPFSRLIGIAVVAPLVKVNLLEVLAGVRLRRRWPHAWGMAQLGVDAMVALAVVWLFAFDPTSALWALFALPVLEGALRAQFAGALSAWALLSVGYVIREVWGCRDLPAGGPLSGARQFDEWLDSVQLSTAESSPGA